MSDIPWFKIILDFCDILSSQQLVVLQMSLTSHVVTTIFVKGVPLRLDSISSAYDTHVLKINSHFSTIWTLLSSVTQQSCFKLGMSVNQTLDQNKLELHYCYSFMRTLCRCYLLRAQRIITQGKIRQTFMKLQNISIVLAITNIVN